MIVINGANMISDMTEKEEKYMESGQLAENERLACQSFLLGDVEIMVPNMYKFPHMIYTK